MKIMQCLSGLFATTVLIAAPAMAAPVLPEGTPITGNPTSLLGFDAGANDYFAGGVSAVDDANIEFVTDDFTLFIDFQSDGLLRLFDNLGTGDDVFNTSLQFSFAGLATPLNDIAVVDVSALTAGKLLFNVIGANTFLLSLNDVQFSPGFSHLDLRISVGEPSTPALFALGVLMVCAVRRRRSLVFSNADVTP